MKFVRNFIYPMVPFIWSLILVLIYVCPVRLFRNYHQSLPLVLISIFYFAIFSPRRLNIFFVFLLGLLTDFLSLSPIGLHACIFSFLFFVTNLLSGYVRELSFRNLWIFFTGIMLICDILWAWLGRLSVGVWISASFWFVQYLFTCLLYPIILWITSKVHRYTMEVDQW